MTDYTGHLYVLAWSFSALAAFWAGYRDGRTQ